MTALLRGADPTPICLLLRLLLRGRLATLAARGLLLSGGSALARVSSSLNNWAGGDLEIDAELRGRLMAFDQALDSG
jgi:hypothetical protein